MTDHESIRLEPARQSHRHLKIPGWKIEPWPSITSQWLGSLSGDGSSAAPVKKSETTASMGIPRPAIIMPKYGRWLGSDFAFRGFASPDRCSPRRCIFADYAIGADGEQPLAWTPTSGTEAGKFSCAAAHVHQACTSSLGGLLQPREASQANMQTRDDIDPGGGSLAQGADPMPRYSAADGGRAEVESGCAPRPASPLQLLDPVRRHRHCIRAGELPCTRIRAPLDQSERRFCISSINSISQKNHKRNVELYDIDAHSSSLSLIPDPVLYSLTNESGWY